MILLLLGYCFLSTAWFVFSVALIVGYRTDIKRMNKWEDENIIISGRKAERKARETIKIMKNRK